MKLPVACPDSFVSFSAVVLSDRYIAQTGKTTGQFRSPGESFAHDYAQLRAAVDNGNPEAIEIAKLFLVWCAKRRLMS